MTDDADDLDRRLARLFEEGRRREDPEDHPAPEKLSAYQAGELPPEEADAIQEHLVQCAFCTDLLLDLEGFLEPQEEEEEREGVADLGTEAGWRKLREEMGWKGRQGEPTAEPSQQRRRFRAFQTIAALLLVGVLGAFLYHQHSLQTLRDRPVVEEFVRYDQNYRAKKGQEIRLPSQEKVNVTLLLDGSGLNEPSGGHFRVEVRHKGEAVLDRDVRLKDENLALSDIPSEDLKPGTYTIEVYEAGKEPPVLLRQYTIQVKRK